MNEPDIKAIWNSGVMTPSIPSMEETAKSHKKRSLQIVDRIRTTARAEHRVFLIIMAIAIPLLALLGFYRIALGLVIFTGLIIWKYEVEMAMFGKVKLQSSTLDYLVEVKALLHWYMRNYRVGILIAVPLITAGVVMVKLSHGETPAMVVLQDSIFWLTLVAGMLLAVFLSRLWLHLWTRSLYGKKFRELDRMINALKEE